MKTISKLQLGKQGITQNFIEALKTHFNKHQNVKLSVLRSALSEEQGKKEQVKKYSEEILDKLGKNYSARVVGFTINIKKWRRNIRE